MPPTSLFAVVRWVHKLAAPCDTAAASDAYLLSCFLASGDQAAFGALVQRHGPPWFWGSAGACCVTTRTRRMPSRRHSWSWLARQAPFARGRRSPAGCTA